MVIALTLNNQSLLSDKIYLTGFQNASFPSVVYSRSKRGGYQGNKVVTPTFASYQFVLTFQLIGSSFADLNVQRDNFMAILGTIHTQGTQRLLVTRSDGGLRFLDVKAVQVTGDLTADDGVSSILQVTLEGEYPFLQSYYLTSQDVQILNGGGMAIPMSIPLSLGNGTTNQVTMTNNGNIPAYPTFTFTGKLTNPSIVNNTTGQTLSLTYSLADTTQSIIVDTYNHSVILGPSGNVARQYTSGAFWQMPLGNSVLTLGNSNSSDGGKCKVAFADSWLNI